MLIGLTGGIASGKTTAARLLAERGAEVIDADELAHALLAPGTQPNAAVKDAFPSCIRPDGTIDRKVLGRLVFSDPSERSRLEAILHPAVLAELKQAAAKARAHPESLVVLVIPLLFELGLEELADEIWLLSVPRNVQIERLMRRDGLERSEAENRLAAQLPLERKLPGADAVLDNEGDPQALSQAIDALLRVNGKGGTR